MELHYDKKKNFPLSMCSVIGVMYRTVHAVTEDLKVSVTATDAMV